MKYSQIIFCELTSRDCAAVYHDITGDYITVIVGLLVINAGMALIPSPMAMNVMLSIIGGLLSPLASFVLPGYLFYVFLSIRMSESIALFGEALESFSLFNEFHNSA